MDKLLGFAPDADPTTPGVLTECANFIPYEQGMRACPLPVTPAGTPVLPAACLGAAVVTKLDDTRRIVAGTGTKLYELAGGAWVDRSRAAVYTSGVDTVWSLAQFGDSTLAANGADVIQRSTGGAFADIGYALRAKVLFSAGAFVMALGTTDATYGVSPDRWWCCAAYDDTSWTPSVSTLATTGRLVSAPGKITAGGRLGEYAVVYKEKAIYVGQFVGAPAVWDFVQIPGGEAGCVGQDAWCNVGAAHFIVGMDNIWLFDGSRPVSVAHGQVRQWFFENSSPSYRYRTKCVFDQQNNLVWVCYPGKNSTVCDAALVYHLGTRQWGRATLSVQCILNYISAGMTIDNLPTVSATINGLSAYAFDSQYWLAGGRSLAIFNAANQLQTVTGVAGASGFTTGDAGDDELVSLLRKVRLRFAPNYKPASASVKTFYKMTEGDALTDGPTGPLVDGKFDVLQSARWHRAKFDCTGDVRVLAMGAMIVPQGNQ